VVNNDSLNCDSSNFSLTKSCLSGWTCSLTSSLSIPPGQSKTTSFSATSPSPPYSRGNYEISVTATNSAVPEYSSTGYGIYQVANNPPTASISCHPQGCDLAVGSCTGYTQTTFCLKNNSTDPDNSSDIKNSIWTITGPVSETSDCSVTGNPLCNWGLLSHFPAGNYSAQLYVEDKLRESDTASQPFTILQEAIADFDCSLVAAEGSWQDCNSLRVSEGEVVFFRDKSTPSQGAAIISWSWQFEDGTPLTSNSASFEVVDAGSGGVTLIINDSAGRSDNVFYQVRVTTPLPEWQEIPPF